MKRKILSMILTMAMTAALFAGCGSNPDKPAEDGTEKKSEAGSEEKKDTEASKPEDDNSENAITLKWAIWDKDITPYWNAIKETYEATHKNVTIEMTDLGSTDYMTVLATELSGSGSDFDVVTIKDVPGYATLVSKNTLEPLDSYISSAGIDLSQYGGVDSQISVNGSLYELPFRNDFWVVFYNKDIFDAAEVPYPTNDMTFEEYDELARKVTDTTFGSQIYGTHYHTWRSAVQLFGVLDGKHSILDGNYEFFKPYYEMVLGQEDDQVCRNYADLTSIVKSYFKCMKDNFLSSTAIWIILAAVLCLLLAEFRLQSHMEVRQASFFFWMWVVMAALYLLLFTVIFPLSARLDAGVGRLFFMAFMTAIKNFSWVLLMSVTIVCIIAIGIFVFWPVLLFSAGGIAYIHSAILEYIIFPKYNWNEK